MKQSRALQHLVTDVVSPERVVGASAVQEHAVDMRRVDHHCVRAGFTGHDDHALRQVRTVVLHDPHDRAPKEVIADLTHQSRVHAQPVQAQPGIGHRATRRQRRRADLRKSTWRQVGLKLTPGIHRKAGDNVQADVPGNDHFDHRGSFRVR